MRKLPSYLLLLLLPALFTGCGKPEAPAKPAAPPSKPLPIVRIAREVSDCLPNVHLNRNEFDDRIATNALMLFIDSLDYDHTFFLASDIEQFQLQAAELDNLVSEGDTDFAGEVFRILKTRVINRVDYANRLLDRGFADMEADETYRWKRDDAPWAADEAEWDELWRKKVKNEYVSRLAMLEEELEEPAEESGTNVTETAETNEILSPEEFIRERYKQYQLLIENNFDQEMVLTRYLSAFTQSYDPHSDYLSPRGVEDFDISMRLSLVGIGAMLRSEDGAAKIQSLITGGPAEADGRLQPGDKIIAVSQGDEEPVSILHWPLSKAVRIIRGEKGSKVVLTIIPADDATETRTKTIDLVRDEVKLEEQAAKGDVHEMTGGDGVPYRIGVVTIPEFYANFEAARNGDFGARRVSKDVRRILAEFATNDVDGIIVDLRNDGGGALTEAVDITGLFIPAGPVVQVRERFGVSVLPDGDVSTVYDGPLIVLVNRLSASASEIVAAALQDYERAVIVGDSKTHGKGTVQTVYPLSKKNGDLGSLKVTTASFYRIAGGSTQIRGVTPDIVLPSLFDALEIGEEFLPNALPWSRLRSAYYRPYRKSVKPMLPELQARSAARMTGNPTFETFLLKRERIRKRMETPEISLKLSDRVNEMVEEKALQELQDSTLKTAGTNQDDPVLNETLHILSDMIDLSVKKPVVRITKSELKP